MALTESTPQSFNNTVAGLRQCKLDTGVSMLVYDAIDDSTFYGRTATVSGGTISFGATTEIIGASTRGAGDVDQLTADKVIFGYDDDGDSNQMKLRVLTVSGTTITAQTADSIGSQTGNGGGWGRIVATDSTKGLFSWTSLIGSQGMCRFTVSGNTVTAGTVVSPSDGNSLAFGLGRIDDDRILRAYTSSGDPIRVQVLNINTSTIVEGTASTVSGITWKSITAQGVHCVKRVDTDKMIVVTADDTAAPNELIAFIVTTSGNTISAVGSVFTVLSSNDAAGASVSVIDTSTVIISYRGASGNSRIETLNISGTTITSNSDVITGTHGINDGNVTDIELVQSGNAILSVVSSSDSDGYASVITGLPVSSDELRYISIDSDVENIYVTGNDSGTLELYTYDIMTLTLQDTDQFGAATYAELDSGDKNFEVSVKPTVEGVLYAWGKDGSDVIVQYNDTEGTLGWVDVGAGTATWGTALVAVGLEIDPLDPNDVVIAFNDGEFYRTEEGTTNWSAASGSVGADILNVARHPILDSQIIVGGTATGTIHYTHNYGYSFKDRGGTVAGTIHGWAISR